MKKALELSPRLDGQSPDFPTTPVDAINEAIADSLLATDNAGDAFEYARAAYEARPSAARAVMAAKSAAARKSWGELAIWIDRAQKIEPDNREALLLAIDLALERGVTSDAERALQKLSAREDFDASGRHTVKVLRARIDAAQRLADAKAKGKGP